MAPGKQLSPIMKLSGGSAFSILLEGQQLVPTMQLTGARTRKESTRLRSW